MKPDSLASRRRWINSAFLPKSGKSKEVFLQQTTKSGSAKLVSSPLVARPFSFNNACKSLACAKRLARGMDSEKRENTP